MVVRHYADYKTPLMNAILYLKYRPDRDLARLMATWLSEILDTQLPLPDLIVAVPLGPKRQQERGYNQVAMIASELAQQTRIYSQENALIRIRETESQVGLDEQGRASNVLGAFKADQGLVAEKKVLLVDDLITTGATIYSCAQALSHAGAETVIALAVGRAIRPIRGTSNS